ncbi:MAG: hypothetical protein CVV29_01255, partial [Methanobacteriales archaeon HGW-Methanobacteriales-2]
MKKFYIILFLTSFIIFFSFLGCVSAANLTVNPGNSIQAAVNNASAGDLIVVNDNNGSSYTYTENVVINKKLTLKSKTLGHVTIRALNPSLSTLIINSDGSGSTIQGFMIKGSSATDCNGIYLNGVSNCNIIGNFLTNNYNGIRLLAGSNNNIQNNSIFNNSWMAVTVVNSNNNIIKNNTIINNEYCIYLRNSKNIDIIENNLAGGGMYGINPQYSTANIKFNKITGCTTFGIVNQENSAINATNNWWGKNNPTASTNPISDICNFSGTITYNPWLTLTITSSTNSLSHNTTCNITADLT